MFLVWCISAGLNLQGEVDITEPRYLCDKHFSGNYVSSQARRKMLVHTAIPFKWKEDIDIESPPDFHIIGTIPEKKRKIREYTLNELATRPISMLHHKSPPKVLNQRRSSNRLSGNSSTSQQEAEEDEDSQSTEEQNEEAYKIESVSPAALKPSITLSDEQPHYEEFLIQPQLRKKFQYIFVKPKLKTVDNMPNVSRVMIRNTGVVTEQHVTEKEEKEEECYVEDADISSTNLESTVERLEEITAVTNKQTEALESYSEFIFNGEKYVQMPKRIFEAELEKVRKESEQSKSLLRKLKTYLLKMDLD